MEQRHRDILRKNLVAFTTDLLVDEVLLGTLVSEGILNDNMREEVEVCSTRQKKASKLMSYIPRRGKNAFRIFVEALMSSGQRDLAELLDTRIVEEWLIANPPGKVKKSSSKSPMQCSEGDDHVTVSQSSIPEWVIPEDWPDYSKGNLLTNLHVNTDTPAHIKALQNTTQVYTMTSKIRGRCIIIDNETFTGEKKKLRDRVGSSIDFFNLDSLFSKLGYATDCWKNLTGEEILRRCEEERTLSEHADYDSFVMCILSHGAPGAVYGTDGDKVPIWEIVKCFGGDKCPALTGKPKLFFIQACQGNSKDSGVPRECTDSGVDDATSKMSKMKLDDDKKCKEEKERGESSVDSVPFQKKVAKFADIFIATASFEDYVSWRNEQYGTWFIRAVVEVFCERACYDTLLSLLTKVKRLVSKAKTVEGGYVQAPATYESLPKDLYFYPEPQSNPFM